MATLPTGTLTILFTDIEGSTRLLQRIGRDEYSALLGQHHRLIRAAIGVCQGIEVKTEGDAFFAVFPRAADAVSAAAQAQRALAEGEWASGSSPRVRMGVHTGDVELSDGEYVGIDVHRAARISSAAHGGQVLLSARSAALVGTALPPGVTLRDLGEHSLKDFDDPERLVQLVIDSLPSDFPPPHAQTTRFNLLPAEMSTFIGRAEVLARATELLAGTRLLTLTGPGGTGKTRLSLRLAQAAGDNYPDGVAFVPLASITDSALVLPSIRQGLGLAEQPGKPALATLTERLVGRDVLLVLDNFEQIVDAAPMVAQLLQAASELTLVVTSRTALHVTGEQEFAVPPLEVPKAADVIDLNAVAASEAVALFVQRAQAVKPEFRLTADNAAVVLAICARLDGLPLAIELAGSRVKLMSPTALLARLEHSLDVLQSTSADRTDRQRTLRGAIDWSYELLTDAEKALFRRAAIFVGGWRLDDAEVILPAAGPLAVDAFGGVAGLLDHSLVLQVDTEAEPRFTMLETIREYGREQLAAAGELDATGAAHAAHYASLVEQAEPQLTAGREWADRLEADQANLRAALAWLETRDLKAALLMAGRLWRFWHLRGHLREGAAVTGHLLDLSASRDEPAARAKALLGLAGLVYWQVNYPLARASYEEALELGRQLEDEKLQVEALYSLAMVRAIDRDYDGASRDLLAARELFERQGSALMGVWTHMAMGLVESLRGNHDEGLVDLSYAESRFIELGESFGLRNTLSVQTHTLTHLGRYDEARVANRRMLELAHEERDFTSLSAGLLDAAALAALSGSLPDAALLTGAAQRIVAESGGQPPPELIARIEALPTLREKVDADELERLLADGRAMTTAEAVSLALTA